MKGKEAYSALERVTSYDIVEKVSEILRNPAFLFESCWFSFVVLLEPLYTNFGVRKICKSEQWRNRSREKCIEQWSLPSISSFVPS